MKSNPEYPFYVPTDEVAPGTVYRGQVNSAKVSYVPLRDGGWCKVSTFDLDRLQALGMSTDDWFVEPSPSGSWRVLAPSKNPRVPHINVARAIYGAGHFDTMSFGFGGPLDMSRNNVRRKYDHSLKEAFLRTSRAAETPVPRFSLRAGVSE